MSAYSRSGTQRISRKRPVQARSRDTVATILEAAAHVLVSRGYVGFTTNHVAVRAGVSIGSVYQYFPHKDALLAALAERDMQAAQEAMLAALTRLRDAQLGPLAWSRALVHAWCEAHANAHQAALYAISAALPGVQERAEAAMGAVSAEVARQLRRRGVSRATVRARTLLLIAFILVHEQVIAVPPGRARRRAENEAAEAVAAYLGRVQSKRGARSQTAITVRTSPSAAKSFGLRVWKVSS